MQVIQELTEAEKPLSIKEIATRTNLSKIYTRGILKSLIKQEYVLEFKMGGRTLYYLLTEKGLKLSQEIVVQKS
ncbi:MAG: helix-turn-helix domain-containing protein [Candidatus Hodarchaeota archaeon]